MSPLSETEARAEIRKRAFFLENLTKQDADPYTGKKAGGPKCDPARLPNEISGNDKKGFYEGYSLFSSDTGVLGNCTGRPSDLRTQYLFLYCKDAKSLHLVRFFYSQADPWKTEPVARCN